MDGRRAGARALLLLVLGVWHGVVLLALMPRAPRVASVATFVSVLLDLPAAEEPARSPDGPPLELSPAPAIAQEVREPRAISWPAGETPSPRDVPPGGSAIDWHAEAARAAIAAAATVQIPEEGPRIAEEGYWSRPHRKGEEAPIGPGKWLLWVSERCYTVIDHLEPAVPGKPMAVHCATRKAPIDAEVLLRRRPRHLEAPLPGDRPDPSGRANPQ